MSNFNKSLSKISTWLGLDKDIWTNPDEGILGNVDLGFLLDENSPLNAFPIAKMVSLLVKKAISQSPDDAFKFCVAFAYAKTFEEATLKYYCHRKISDANIKKSREAQATELSEQTVKLDSVELEKIYQHDFVQQFCRPFFEELLTKADIDKTTQDNIAIFIADNLSYNVYFLLYEKEANYGELSNYLNNPAHQAALKRHKKGNYEAKLRHKYYDKVLNDEKGLSLADLYIMPNCGIMDTCIADKRIEGEQVGSSPFYNAPNPLHPTVYDFLQGKYTWETPHDLRNARVLLLLGYPGQGKSSFCKRLLFDNLSGSQPLRDLATYFVPLRNISNIALFRNNPIAAFRDYLGLESQTDQANIDLQNALLVLDGLDEVYMQHSLNSSDINNLLLTLTNEAQNRNLRIVITSRYGYVDLQWLQQRPILVLQLSRLTLAQQTEWLQAYKRYHPTTALNEAMLEQYDQNEQLKHIKELIDQPILLHIIATLTEAPQTDATTRADIYRQLFDQLTARAWAKGEGQLEAFTAIKKDKTLLRYALQDIAFAMFRNKQVYIQKNDLEHSIDKDELLKSLKKLREAFKEQQMEDVLRGVMMAFYMHETQTDERKNGNYAVEFLHQSLQEYLCAEKIWRSIGKDGFLKTTSDGDFIIDSNMAALEKLQQLFADRLLSPEVRSYLLEIMGIEAEEVSEKKGVLAERLAKFMPYLLNKQFLYSYTAEQEQAPISRALRTFHAYTTILHNLQTKKNYIPDNKESREQYAQLIRWAGAYFIRSLHLPYQDLGGASLGGASLAGASLAGANLSDANLFITDLFMANLSRANLSRANLSRANLIGTNLSRANLIDADLSDVYLIDANLSGANLIGANLSGANLSGANLIGANLSVANLSVANLIDANLSGAKLSGAKVEQVDWFAFWLEQPNPPRGLKELSEKYIVLPDLKEDEFGLEYYRIVLPLAFNINP
jgi:hypothetical protein